MANITAKNIKELIDFTDCTEQQARDLLVQTGGDADAAGILFYQNPPPPRGQLELHHLLHQSR